MPKMLAVHSRELSLFGIAGFSKPFVSTFWSWYNCCSQNYGEGNVFQFKKYGLT